MKICVYGASSHKLDAHFIEEGEKLGRAMVARGHSLVFGAGGNGLMGAVARGVHAGGGESIGVVPTFFNVDGMLFEHCTQLIRTETMRERKQIMEDNGDAFVMSPGGIGTFEEFFEVLTLKQLGRHAKPIAILNTGRYYNTLLAMMDEAMEQQFMKTSCKSLYGVFEDVDEMLTYIEEYVPNVGNIGTFKNVYDAESELLHV
ncbi:MAG: TIGR00730 family Rossman fold protein [Eubacteriales bacterium]